MCEKKIVEFSNNINDYSHDFIQIGGGSLGGKARGLAFANTLISETIKTKFKSTIIKIPKNISIVARKGFAWQSKTLDLVNLSKAKQIIILKPDVGEINTSELDCDVEVGKSFTYLIANENWQKNPCNIVAEFHDTSTSNLYLNYCKDIIKEQREKLEELKIMM